MNGLWAPLTAALAIGASLGGMIGARINGRAGASHGSPDIAIAAFTEAAPLLTDADRQVISAEFAQHVGALDREVTAYADALAGPDLALRGYLAAIQSGKAAFTLRDEVRRD